MDFESKLDFEELVECRAWVLRLYRRGRCLALHGLLWFKQLAFVAHVFLCYSLGNRFSALKARAGIEAHTVLADVQIVVTLGHCASIAIPPTSMFTGVPQR